MDERRAWVALASVDGVGPVTFARLIARHGSASAVLGLAGGRGGSARILGDLPRRSAEVADRIAIAALAPDLPAEHLTAMDGWALTPLDPGWPTILDRIEDPPPILYGRGRPDAILRDSVAIVGTRHPTPEGIHLAERVAAVATAAGWCVVSGLALGIDIAAHAATLAGDGWTVGVSGGGLSAGWPRRNDRVAQAIARGRGAIVTELAPGSVASVGTFPRRNRIIAALSRRTIVIEAPIGSGALITARHALAQGRPVHVVSPVARGPSFAGGLELASELLAEPISLDDLIAHLEKPTGGPQPTTTAEPTPETGAAAGARSVPAATAAVPLVASGMPHLGPLEAAAAERLARGPATPDAIGALLGVPPGVTAGVLLMLQLRGLARPWGGVWLAGRTVPPPAITEVPGRANEGAVPIGAPRGSLSR